MTYNDRFEPASFDGIAFPYSDLKITCGVRSHEHEYPHQDKVALEKLGRRAYKVHVTVMFQADVPDPKWLGLFEERLPALRKLWEASSTKQFHVPHIGDLPMMCGDWSEELSPRNRNGARVEMDFVEDASDAFDFVRTVQTTTRSFPQKVELLGYEVEKRGLHGLFDQITILAAQILGYKDTLDLYGALVTSKIDGLISLLRMADQQVQELNDPINYELLDAFRELCAATIQLQKDVLELGIEKKFYVVPAQMTITDVATALFGDTRRGVEVMRMNEILDPMAIVAGTRLAYYDLAA